MSQTTPFAAMDKTIGLLIVDLHSCNTVYYPSAWVNGAVATGSERRQTLG